jgi:hypothetical protein
LKLSLNWAIFLATFTELPSPVTRSFRDDKKSLPIAGETQKAIAMVAAAGTFIRIDRRILRGTDDTPSHFNIRISELFVDDRVNVG